MISGLNFETRNNVLPLNTHVPLATQLSPLTPVAATHVRRTTTSTLQSQLGYISILFSIVHVLFKQPYVSNGIIYK